MIVFLADSVCIFCGVMGEKTALGRGIFALYGTFARKNEDANR